MYLLHPLLFPPRWMRLFALLSFVLVAAKLPWHGAQPSAVGAIPPPWDKLAHVVVYGGRALVQNCPLSGETSHEEMHTNECAIH